MFKIFKYSFVDMLRSKWAIVYILFYLLTTFSLLYFSSNLSKAIISLMNIILLIVPLISTMLGVIYYYNSLEFAELLLAQPIKRSYVFMGKYLGISFSLSLSLLFGLGIPFLIYGIHISNDIWNFFMLMIIGFFLTFIFTGFAFCSSILFYDKIKGFGLAIAIWLFMTVIYDGLFLLFLILFNDYPLEKATLILSISNPIDLSRILMILKLDIAALMGYTGAVFNKFFGTGIGMLIAFSALLLWVIVPIFLMLKILKRKDF